MTVWPVGSQALKNETQIVISFDDHCRESGRNLYIKFLPKEETCEKMGVLILVQECGVGECFLCPNEIILKNPCEFLAQS